MAGERPQRDIPQIAGPVDEVGVRELLENREKINRSNPFRSQMAVRVQLGANKDIGPNDGSYACQKIAFAVVIAIGHHRPVQPEHHRVHGHRRLQLPEDLVSQALIRLAVHRSGRIGPARRAFDQLESACRRQLAVCWGF